MVNNDDSFILSICYVEYCKMIIDVCLQCCYIDIKVLISIEWCVLVYFLFLQIIAIFKANDLKILFQTEINSNELKYQINNRSEFL